MSNRLYLFWRQFTASWRVLGLVLLSYSRFYAQTVENSDFEIRRLSLRDGLANHTITAFCMDGNGALWIGTMGGLFLFDGIRLDHFVLKDEASRQILVAPIAGIEVGVLDPNLMFVCTINGILVLHATERQVIPDTALGLPPGFLQTCTRIVKSSGGFYWLLSGQTVYKLIETNNNRLSCQPVYSLPPCKVSSLFADPTDPEGLWILPSGLEAYYLNLQDLQHFTLPENKANPNAMPGLLQWVYTQKGVLGWDRTRNIYRFNAGQKRIELVNDEYDLYDILPNMERVDRFIERKPALNCTATLLAEQQLFGTDLGLFIVREKKKRFEIIEPLRGEEIRGLHADNSGKWWAGTYNGVYSGHQHQNKVNRLSISHVWDFLPLTDHLYLLGQEVPKGIWVWDMNLNAKVPNAVQLSHIDKNLDELTCLTVCKDTRGVIWAGTYKHLLWAEAYAPYTFHLFTDVRSGQMANLKNVRALLADKKSGIWAGYDHGLLRIVYNELLQGYEIDSTALFLKGVAVSDLYQDKHNRMWIATKGEGIGCLDLNDLKKPIQWYNNEDGLCNDLTCRIEGSHNDEVLWVSTHNGLSRFDVRSGAFHNFYEGNGFPGNEFNSAASARFPDGTLMFGGVSGLIRFHPDSIPAVDFQHKTILSGASFYDQLSTQLSPLSIFSRAGLLLPSYPEYFELRLGSTEFVETEKVRFRYRLHGLSELWTYINGDGEVKFIRLAPGNYLFEAQAILLDGTLAKPVLLPIFVETPYYETWWFKTLLVAFFLGIGYLAYLYRVRQLLNEQRMRQQIADDLHDDIGNKLTIINMVAQKMIKDHPENVAQTTGLNKLINVSKNALRSLHTMIWSVDSKKDRISSLVNRMQDFADGYLRPLGIKFHFELVPIPNRNINLPARHHIIMIYQELLTNMVKYTRPALITVSIKLKGDTLHLNIVNEHQVAAAPGFGASSTSRGLSTIERRLNRINGQYTWVEPSENRQEITLIVPRVFKRS